MTLCSVLVASLAFKSPTMSAKSIYDFSMKDIDGKLVPLSKYKGKVLLIVNVASFCGNTPQYKGLEAMYRDLKSKGFVILGFPANNFGAQEPGSEKEIKEFCTAKYDVTFPMFSKISVKGDDQAPLYKWLIENSENKSDVDWNFAKFLVGKDGHVITRFSARTAPSAAELKSAIEAALSAR